MLLQGLFFYFLLILGSISRMVFGAHAHCTHYGELAVLTFLFAIILSLIFLHEMDAVRHCEWRMFKFLGDMEDEKAYTVFLWLHFPLYALALGALFTSYNWIIWYGVNAFLVGHGIVHELFAKHPKNSLTGAGSVFLTRTMAVLASVHGAALLMG